MSVLNVHGPADGRPVTVHESDTAYLHRPVEVAAAVRGFLA